MQIVPLQNTVHIHTRINRTLKAEVKRRADKLGIPENTVINSALASALGFPTATKTKRRK